MISIFPYRAVVQNGQIKGWAGGFSEQHFLDLYALKRQNGLFGEINKTKYDKLIEIKEDVYYGGVIFPYFGHFLLETLTNIPSIPNDSKKIVFSLMGKVLKPWQKDIFSLLGLSDRVIIADEKEVRVNNILYSPQNNIINYYISPNYIRWAKNIIPIGKLPNTDKTIDKIYISRKYEKNASVINEPALEEFMKDAGYHILYPEKITFPEQLSLYRNAKKIVGVEGSALHSLMFYESEHIQKLLVLSRRKTLPYNFSQQFFLQDRIIFTHAVVSEEFAKMHNSSSTLDLNLCFEALNNANYI